MGYANELGEAFTSYLPEWGLPASYCVAASYVMFDTIDKGQKAYDAAEEEDKLTDTLRISAETMTWQMLASVFWPGSIIRVIVNMAAHMAGDEHQFLPTLVRVLHSPQRWDLYLFHQLCTCWQTLLNLSEITIFKKDKFYSPWTFPR